MKTSELFAKAVSEIPKDIRKQVDMSFAISDKISLLLDERGMTQKDLAKTMRKSESEVSRWMSGTHNFSVATLAKISHALGCDIITI